MKSDPDDLIDFTSSRFRKDPELWSGSRVEAVGIHDLPCCPGAMYCEALDKVGFRIDFAFIRHEVRRVR